MANLKPTLALISILLVIIANASAYRTTITTIEINDSEGSSSQQCRQEVQKKDLSSCEQYLSQSHSESSPGEEALIKMPNDDESQQQAGRQQLQQCCSEVKQLRDECQCEALKTIVQQLSQRGEKQEYPQVISRAGEIQSSCGLGQCSIRTYPTHQSCDEQIQKQQDLRQCQDYIRQQISKQGSSRGGSQQLRGCCDHLKQMQSQCRCQGLSSAIEQQQRKGQLQGQDVSEAFRTAKELPSMCGVSPSECQF